MKENTKLMLVLLTAAMLVITPILIHESMNRGIAYGAWWHWGLSSLTVLLMVITLTYIDNDKTT